MLDHLFTFLMFVFAMSLTPGLALCYLCVRACHSAWLQVLTVVHSDVDFISETTVRTLVDTRRNQGIFTVLLRVEGEPRVDLVRHHLQEVVTRVNKLGEPRFPKLSMLLVSHWGSYAWKRLPPGKEFSVDQVLVMGCRSTHRGRPLTELNVQEHVSDIITRYLPRGIPPWQLVILPCAGSESHYILLRMHHLLLTDGDVNIADLLPMAASPEPILSEETLKHYLDSPLVNVLERPDHIRCLYETLTENLTNKWNEFTSNHDPLNRPELLKTTQELSGYFATVMVALVAIFRRILIGYRNISPDTASRLRYAKACMKHELASRRISIGSFLASLLVTLHPWNVIRSTVQFCYWLFTCTWRVPMKMAVELQAICYRAAGYRRRDLLHSTITDTICDFAPMVNAATGQIFRWMNAVYTAPKLFADELIRNRGWPGGTPVPLCGRKVVAWSKPISGERLRIISKATGFSCTEVLLAALGGTLNDYYRESGSIAPVQVPITARRISSGYLFSRGPNVRPQDALSGILCLRVPTVAAESSSEIGMDYPGCLIAVASNLKAARAHQACVYAMSILQTKHRIVTRALPSVFVSVLLKYLSQKYTVSVTELVAGDEGGVTRYTTWGKKISDIIYWRPPQANISISLCLNYYGDNVTLAVMSDALLSPHHIPLAEGFQEHVEALASSLGV